MTSRRLFAHIAFALSLLLSQQLGMAHVISHFSSDKIAGASRDKPLPVEMQCSQCLAFAAIGSALNGSPAIFSPATVVTRAPVTTAVASHTPAIIRAFNSRAPPVTL